MADQKPPFDLGEMSKLLSQFKVPEIDWQGLMATQQKNWAALGQANQKWLESAQVVMRHEVEMVQKAMAEAAEVSKSAMSERDPGAAAMKRLEHAKASFEKAIGSMRALSETASQSHQEAIDIIQRRAIESFDEIKAMIKAKQP
jgi:phasin family protein